jgi:hypothetical protein
MIPAADTIIIVEDELEGARHWAERRSVPLVWLPDRLELRATLVQPETKEPFYLRGIFDNYKAIAPAWTFSDATWALNGGAVSFPKVITPPHGSPMFITGGSGAVICVPFNRLAYVQHGGPHGDWGGSTNWLNAGGAYVRAETVADMLQAIRRDFLHTCGRMGTP